MINSIRKNFGWQLDDLSRSLQENYHRESPDSNFAHYVFYQANSQIPFAVANDIDFTSLEESRLNQAPAIAAVGYGLACGREFSKSFLEIWVNGLTRLSGREAFPSDRTSFFYRPTELLGIILGVSHYYKNQPEKTEWLQKILIEGEQRLIHNDLWTYLLCAYAGNILSVNWGSRSLPLVSNMSLDELALVKWLCIIDSNLTGRFGLKSMEAEINKTLLEHFIKYSNCIYDSSHSALLHFALKITIAQTIQLCWSDVEQIHANPQAAIEWLSNTCNNFHSVTQSLQSYFSRESTFDTLNVTIMKTLIQLLSRLHSDASIVKSEIDERIRMNSGVFIGINQGMINTGDKVTMNSKKESVTNTTVIGANSTIGVINSGSGTVSSFSQNIGQNVDDIAKLVRSLRDIAQQFPEAQRQEALVTLDDLQEDISNPEKQKPERIKVRLGRLIAIAGMIAGLVAGAADFSNNVLELSEKLGVPIDVNLQSIQKLPPSTPNLTGK